MSKDNPDAVEELKKGLGHLFNAAKSAVNDLPTKDLEDAVLTGVKEVGRALGNVKDTLETEFLGKHEKHDKTSSSQPAAAPSEAHSSSAPAASATPATQAAAPEAPAAAPEHTRIADDAAKPAPADAPATTPAAEPDTGGGI